jgi:hypothetical protein
MATVAGSQRQLTHTSNTYESNGDVTIGGNLNINGTTTTIDTANLLVEDKNIVIGDVSSPTNTTADGGGITLKGATDKTINWINSTSSWTSNQTFSAPNLTLTNLSNQSSEATALVVNGSNVVGYRELGSAAFSNTSAFLGATAKAADSDKLDNLNSTQFLRSDANDSFSGNLTNNGSNYITFGPNSTWSRNLRIGANGHAGNTTTANIATTNGNLHLDAAVGSYATYLNYYAGTAGIAFGNGASANVAWMGPDGDLWKGAGDNSGSRYWHAGNDGSGSGLDADLLDGQHASAFQAAGTYNTIIGTDSDINTSGSTIIDNIYVTDGVITSMGTRTLGAGDIGAAYYDHIRSLGTQSFTNGSNPNITTAQVMSEIETDGGFEMARGLAANAGLDAVGASETQCFW